MMRLNLPEFDCKLQKSEGKVWIFDVIRKKYMVLTPEEWVRQHLINYFIHHLQYPKGLIKIEGGLQYNTLQKRSDIVVYDTTGKPWMLVECKSYDVPLNQQVIRQASMYNATLAANFITVSNGLKHVCFRLNSGEGITQLNNFPAFDF